MFILLVFMAAIGLEAIGTIMSVIGISHLFGVSTVIIALAIMLDVAKLVTVSFTYQCWGQLTRLMKAYALVAALITMSITSAGAFGYLANSFQGTIVGTKEGQLNVSVLQEQQKKYDLRKKQIDDQIANLPSRTPVGQRLRLMNGFKQEQQTLDKKIAEIDRQLPKQQLAQLSAETQAGPIMYVAKAFSIPVEQAVKYVILLITAVVDPLAIFLIVAGNFLWANRRAKKGAEQLGPAEGPRKASTGQSIEPEAPVQEPEVLDATTEAAMDEAHEKAEQRADDEFWEEQDRVSAARRRVFDEYAAKQHAPFVPTRTDEAAINHAHKADLPPANAAPEEHKPLSGLLGPIMVEAQEAPVLLKNLPPRHEEITRSSLDLVRPDQETIVDAHRVGGFRKAQTATSSAKKQQK